MKASDRAREGQVRCLNCFLRFRPPPRSERATCPSCGIEWRISYPYPHQPKIRGPVWDRYPSAR